MAGPDEKRVSLHFTDENRFRSVKLVDIPEPTGMTSEESWGQPGFQWNELSLPQSAKATPNETTTLQTGQLSFTYLDVGLWGDNLPGKTPQRDFGIVWGEWSALCEFGKSGKSTVDERAKPINEVLAALGKGASVKVVKEQFTAARHGLYRDDKFPHVYVILPDFHLPLVQSIPAIPTKTVTHKIFTPFPVDIKKEVVLNPEDRWGRVDFERDDPSSVTQWYQRYINGDIFRGAATDLITFIDNLSSCQLSEDRQLHLVQVGDMYDLWIGLDRFYSQEFSNQRVTLMNRSDPNLEAGKFIDHWVDETNKLFANLMARIEKLPHKTQYLWGNHDNYLRAHTRAPSKPASGAFVRMEF